MRSEHGLVAGLLDEVVAEVQRSIAHAVDRERFELALFSVSLVTRPPHVGFDTIWLVVPRFHDVGEGPTRESERHRRQLAESASTLVTFQRRRQHRTLSKR
ncbi:MAG: hypothetical protein KC609_07325 [Myxococcales bacterium]|nr:hypothetical protein [Myxococcales bacterium]